MSLVSNALLGLHGFTGCDTVSAIYGKGEAKPLKLMVKDNVYTKTFAFIGEEPGVLGENFEVVEKLVCELYGHREVSCIQVVFIYI